MRSLLGLICVIVAASFYLYSLSSYLPAGPRRRPVQTADREHVGTESEHPDTPEAASGFVLLHKQLTPYSRHFCIVQSEICSVISPITTLCPHKIQLFIFSLENCLCKFLSVLNDYSVYSYMYLNGDLSL